MPDLALSDLTRAGTLGEKQPVDSRKPGGHTLAVTRMRWPVSSSLVLVAILVTGCGSTPTPSAIHLTTTTGKNVVRLEAGGVTVSPWQSIHDGQQVTVSVKGLPPGWKFFVSECLTPLDANALGCGSQLAAQPFGFADRAGSGSMTFLVHSSAATSKSRSLQPCGGECVLVATTGDPVGTPVHGLYYFAPISFTEG